MKYVLATMGLITLLVVSDSLTAQETSSIPQQVIDDWSYFVGEWQIEGQVGGARLTGTASFKWTQGKQSYFGEQVWRIGQAGNVVHLSLIGGWDSSRNRTVEYGFDSSGGSAAVRYEVQAAESYPAAKSGEIDGYSRRRGAWSGKTRIERSGPDRYLLTTSVEGDQLHVLTFRRQTKTDGK